MKKLLTILVSILFWSSLVLADGKLDNALEKCADTQIFLGKNIPKFFYENHEVYKIMKKDRAIFKKNYDDYVEVYKNTYEKYLKDNPRVKPPKYEERKWYTLEDYKRARKIEEEEEKKYLKPFEDKLREKRKILNKQDELINEVKQSLAKNALNKISLKDKARNIENYTKKYTMCENAYNNTPKGFILEWGN